MGSVRVQKGIHVGIQKEAERQGVQKWSRWDTKGGSVGGPVWEINVLYRPKIQKCSYLISILAFGLSMERQMGSKGGSSRGSRLVGPRFVLSD